MPLPRRHTTLLDLDATGDGTLRIFAPPDDPATKAAAYRPDRWPCHANLWTYPPAFYPSDAWGKVGISRIPIAAVDQRWDIFLSPRTVGDQRK